MNVHRILFPFLMGIWIVGTVEPRRPLLPYVVKRKQMTSNGVMINPSIKLIPKINYAKTKYLLKEQKEHFDVSE